MRGLTSALVVLSIAWGASAASAQGIGYSGNRYSTRPSMNPLSRPIVSPYVNLLRNNNSPVLNYYGLVRPEVEALEAENRLRGNIENLDERIRQQRTLTGSQLGASGHAARFMTDLRGRPEMLPIEMQGRRQQIAEQARRTGLVTPFTGHASHFGNNGTFYQPRQ